MADLAHFVSQNLLLCLAFIAALLIYIIFEWRQMTTNQFSISAANAITLTNREKGVFIDIRDGKAYQQSHLIGAIHAPLENIRQGIKSLNKHKSQPLIVYCDQGVTAKNAYLLLKKAGFEKVYVLKGGLKQWLKDSLPVEKSSQQSKSKNQGANDQ
ncbi:MAG: rhodanese-like domain-containing protein [Francisellaceae bacterium]